MLGSAVNDNIFRIFSKKIDMNLLFLLGKMVIMKRYFIG